MRRAARELLIPACSVLSVPCGGDAVQGKRVLDGTRVSSFILPRSRQLVLFLHFPFFSFSLSPLDYKNTVYMNALMATV